MQRFYIIDANNDNEAKPAEPYSFRWKDMLLTVGCACVLAYIVLTGIFAAIEIITGI